MIEGFPKPENAEKRVFWNTDKPKMFAFKSKKMDNVLDKNTEQTKSQRIYLSMARMSYNV